jgi:UDP-N-acetylmuramyl pentapeptide phosphotransferase/UDP-N-acetylglucosamine-1-phosphate transferase
MSRRTIERFLLAGIGARAGFAALASRPPGGEKTWSRTNHRGEPVTLLEGPATAVAAAGAALVMPGLDCREKLALTLAGAGAGAFGCYDDLAGSSDRRGLRGHLGALAGGEVTTGAVKILGIGATGLAASLLLGRRSRSGGAFGQVADVAVNAALVAGSANLLNLFDLRPGRAIKVSLIGAAALAATGGEARAALAAPAGAAVALLNEDLGERAMLGDAGANALGAMLGTAAAATLPRAAKIGVLAGVVGLTLASEKVSFTKVIARTPALNWLDQLGRRPVAEAAPADAAPADAAPADAAPAGPAARPEGGTPLRSAPLEDVQAGDPQPAR